ncbi:MAG: redox-regulated ATPase YchF [Bacteroidetes bacterium]|nr:redox-regulated ATPase YchF [Bacteroidota bacterium]
MGLRIGIVGLPNVGKSTLFNAITSAGAQAANFPFCTIEPNVGVVDVPDARLWVLKEIVGTDKVIPAAVEFVDIAGLVKGASKGEGLGNQFLSNIRECDAILHVVRCFDDDNVIHVDGSVNPKRDIEVIETELIFKDLDTLEKKLQRTARGLKSGDKKAKEDTDLLMALNDHFGQGKPVRTFPATPEQKEVFSDCFFLTDKPVLYVANVAEKDILTGNNYVKLVKEIADAEGARIVTISAAIEAEIAELPMEERKDFLAGLGLDKSGLDQIITIGFDMLGLMTYFTAGKIEVRAWTIHKGDKAPQAAGVIHTDFEKGFIRAEVQKYDDIVRLKSEAAVKEAGLLKVEGKDYVVQDGDVMHFRFNV